MKNSVYLIISGARIYSTHRECEMHIIEAGSCTPTLVMGAHRHRTRAYCICVFNRFCVGKCAHVCVTPAHAVKIAYARGRGRPASLYVMGVSDTICITNYGKL